MLALTRRGSLCLRPHFATAISAPRNSLCSSRGIHFRSGSTNSCKEPVCKSSSSFAIAVSCAALGGFFLTQQTARSDSGHPPPTIVASAPPSSQSFALSGTVPSGASPFNLSYSAACEASNDPFEDRFVVAFSQLSDARFLCVLDGHGGPSVAEYVARALPAAVDSELVRLSPNAEPQDVEGAISRAFVSLDAQLSLDMMKPEGAALRRPGSCALFAVERRGRLHVAHAGDCRAVVSCGKGERLLLVTQDHNAKEEAEQLQLRAAHPGEDDVVTCKHPSACYVKGRLQPTRAFGDFHLKNGREWHRSEWVPTRVRRPGSFTPPYITAKPSTNSVQLQAGETALVILATDGIWDELSSDVAARVAADAVAGGSVPPASAVMDAAFHRAAASSRMTVAQLKSVPPGSDRRRLVDDCTVVVGVFGSRSKL